MYNTVRESSGNLRNWVDNNLCTQLTREIVKQRYAQAVIFSTDRHGIYCIFEVYNEARSMQGTNTNSILYIFNVNVMTYIRIDKCARFVGRRSPRSRNLWKNSNAHTRTS